MQSIRMVQSGVLVGVCAVLLYCSAAAGCFIEGEISAELSNDHPELGAWKYTLSVSWGAGDSYRGNDGRYALSHFNVWLDASGGSCSCGNLAASLFWQNPSGEADGKPCGCDLPFETFLECRGDPSIDLEGKILKFEPIETGRCEAGTAGEGTFVFYSDYPPANIQPGNSFLTYKYGPLVCSGELRGVFPGLPCDPVGRESRSWGYLKQLYHGQVR